MTTHRIASVEAAGYPTLHVTFADGIGGTVNMTESIASGGPFAPLRDPVYFGTVAVGEGGRTFGWNLDAVGQEIDLCADATRIEIETQIVEAHATRFAATRAAAK